jgi:hypothetical protein
MLFAEILVVFFLWESYNTHTHSVSKMQVVFFKQFISGVSQMNTYSLITKSITQQITRKKLQISACQHQLSLFSTSR